MARFSKKLATLTKVADTRFWFSANMELWIDDAAIVSDPQMQAAMQADPASREKMVEARLREMADEKLREVVGAQGDVVRLRNSTVQIDDRDGVQNAITALEKAAQPEDEDGWQGVK